MVLEGKNEVKVFRDGFPQLTKAGLPEKKMGGDIYALNNTYS